MRFMSIFVMTKVLKVLKKTYLVMSIFVMTKVLKVLKKTYLGTKSWLSIKRKQQKAGGMNK